MPNQYSKEFKLNAVQYYQDHQDLSVLKCAETFGVSYSTLYRWLKIFRESEDILSHKADNYSSDEQAEIARLKCELCDMKNDLDILKNAIAILVK